jgi:hypothetical protein
LVQRPENHSRQEPRFIRGTGIMDVASVRNILNPKLLPDFSVLQSYTNEFNV